PVMADSRLVATASETSGPPSIDNTHSRTMAKAGTAATTAPNPTRLATLSTGSTDALAPESIVSRKPGSRRQFTLMTVTIAAKSAVTTAHTPPTAESEVAPKRSSARNETSRRARITSVISTLTLTTTRSG